MSVPKIELRAGETEPRTIYRDLLNLPDPVKLGITIRYFNHDDVDLYFQITGSATGYTFGTVNLGLLASGANAYQNLDEFASRAKPSAETSETITLTLKAYTDSGYTNLKWTYNRNVDVIWIKSDDPSYTQEVLNNFDDGTVQGWDVAEEVNCPAVDKHAHTDFVLSAPYCLRSYGCTTGPAGEIRYRVYKSFTTPNKDKVYAIIDLRLTTAIEEGAGSDGAYSKYLRIQRDTTILVHLGRAYDGVTSHYVPKQKWIRIVVPLPKNTTLELRIVYDYYGSSSNAAPRCGGMRMDDFKIISK